VVYMLWFTQGMVTTKLLPTVDDTDAVYPCGGCRSADGKLAEGEPFEIIPSAKMSKSEHRLPRSSVGLSRIYGGDTSRWFVLFAFARTRCRNWTASRLRGPL